jgi:beta-lactamase class A
VGFEAVVLYRVARMMPASSFRRAFLRQSAAVAALVAAPASWAVPDAPRTRRQVLEELEKKSGGRLGVAILDTESGERIGRRADERFPMCSTFKLLLVAAVLSRVDAEAERLDRRIGYGEADLLEHAPVARARVREGELSVSELCDAAITVSDNTAANLLLTAIGGPAALTAYIRTLGDTATRLDRNEPMLNEAVPGDPRDTTTPAAMLTCLEALLTGRALSPASRERLTRWLVANKTGDQRLRAGVPKSWRIGEKTGTGERGTTNDVGILWPPGRKPILISAYITESSVPLATRSEVLAGVGRLAVTKT